MILPPAPRMLCMLGVRPTATWLSMGMYTYCLSLLEVPSSSVVLLDSSSLDLNANFKYSNNNRYFFTQSDKLFGLGKTFWGAKIHLVKLYLATFIWQTLFAKTLFVATSILNLAMPVPKMTIKTDTQTNVEKYYID